MAVLKRVCSLPVLAPLVRNYKNRLIVLSKGKGRRGNTYLASPSRVLNGQGETRLKMLLIPRLVLLSLHRVSLLGEGSWESSLTASMCQARAPRVSSMEDWFFEMLLEYVGF